MDTLAKLDKLHDRADNAVTDWMEGALTDDMLMEELRKIRAERDELFNEEAE